MKDIIEGNRLIGVFLEAYFVNDDVVAYPNGYYMHDSIDLPYDVEDWQFHSSWDWVMLIVEKVSELPEVYHWELSSETFSIHANKTFEKMGNGIEKVWSVVVKFIKWYNEQEHKTSHSS